MIPFAPCQFYVEDMPLPAASLDSRRMQAEQKQSSLAPPAQLLNRKSFSRSETFPRDLQARISELGEHARRSIDRQRVSRQTRADRRPRPQTPTTSPAPTASSPRGLSLHAPPQPSPQPYFPSLPPTPTPAVRPSSPSLIIPPLSLQLTSQALEKKASPDCRV